MQLDTGGRGSGRPSPTYLLAATTALLLSGILLATHRPATTASTPQPPPTLAQLVPDAPGHLVAVLGAVRPYRMATWQLEETAPRPRPLPPEAALPVLDAEAEWVAVLGQEPGAEPQLMAGRTTTGPIQTVAPRAISAAWHASGPATLAWTAPHRGHFALLTRSSPDSEPQVIFESGAPIGVTAWGDWGFGLIRYSLPGGPLLFTLDGAGILSPETGWSLEAASPGGALLVRTYREAGALFSLSITTPDLREPVELPWAPDDVLAASWSPRGDLLALVHRVDRSSAELSVYRWKDGLVLHRLPASPLSEPSWSPDGRFLLTGASELAPAGARRSVDVLDLLDVSRHRVFLPDELRLASFAGR